MTNPHNPTGKIYTEEELLKLTEILSKWPEIIVISDDVYYHLAFDSYKYISFAGISEENY